MASDFRCPACGVHFQLVRRNGPHVRCSACGEVIEGPAPARCVTCRTPMCAGCSVRRQCSRCSAIGTKAIQEAADPESGDTQELPAVTGEETD